MKMVCKWGVGGVNVGADDNILKVIAVWFTTAEMRNGT